MAWNAEPYVCFALSFSGENQMKSKLLISISVTFILLNLLPVPVNADTVLCLKNKVKSVKTVNLKKAIVARASGVCRRTETRIDTALSAASILAAMLGVDGSGSSLDADTLDGQDSTSFAGAAGLSAVETNVSSLQADVSSLQSDTSSLQADVSSVQSDVSTLQSTSTSHTASIAAAEADVEDLGMGPNLIRVGTSNSQYTDLAAAVSYVTAQARSDTNRYVIQVGPGEFVLTAVLAVPTYTELRGSGIGSTIVQGQDGIDVGSLITLADYSSISHMTVRHAQTEALGSTAVLDSNSTVDADISDPTSFSIVVRDVRLELTSTNPNVSQGLRVDGSDTLVERVEILVSGGTSNYGISSTSGSGDLLVIDSKLVASGSNSYALLYQQSGQVRVLNSILNADTIGVSVSTGTGLIRSSLFSSASTCLRAVSSAVVRVAGSTFECPTPTTELSSGNAYCAYSTDETLTALSADCG